MVCPLLLRVACCVLRVAHRIGAGVIDPNKAILLQNIGARNPYPGYIGGVLENSVGAGIPIVIEAMQKDRE